MAKIVAKIEVGTRVCFKASWLRNTGQQLGSIGQARGTVKALTALGDTTLAEVDWGDEEIPAKVAVGNLSAITSKGIPDE